MIVISDTTPIHYLILVDAIDVLPSLFDEVRVPAVVLDELTHAGAPDAVRCWALRPPAWLKIQNPASRLPSTIHLDPGEAQAISLAKELQIVDILMDERHGTRVARQEGLIPLPTLAILEQASEENLVDLPAVITKLRSTSIRIHHRYFDEALARDSLRRGMAPKPDREKA